MGKHTPGPWYWVNDFDIWDRPRFTPGSFAQSIATMQHRDVGNAEAFANARLVAAAPDLLDALKKCAWVLKECGFSTPVTEDAFDDALGSGMNAIAKAEGRNE